MEVELRSMFWQTSGLQTYLFIRRQLVRECKLTSSG